METGKDKSEPTKDIHAILRQRRESLDRIRASLETVGGLQRQFEEGTRQARNSHRYPLTTLQSILAHNVKLISIEQLKISLTLQDGALLEIEYPSAQTLSEDLRAWSKTAAPEDLKRLDIHAGKKARTDR